MVEMKEVTSSQLAKIGWAKGVLHVIFTGANAEYRYRDVPRDIFEELVASESIGRAFNFKIKGQYAHTKHEIA